MQSDVRQPYGAALPAVVMVAAFLAGAFAPTSTDGVLHAVVSVLYSGVAVLVLLLMRLSMPAPSPWQVLGVGLFAAGVLLGTFASPFVGVYSPGLIPSFVGVALLLLAAPVRLSPRGIMALHRAIRWTGVIYAAWVAGIFVEVSVIQELTIRFFPAHYQELVRALVLTVRHPVAAWGTHSVAALFFFLLALYFRHDAATSGSRLSFGLSIFWVAGLFSLQSFSGLFLGLWATGLLVVPGLAHVPGRTRQLLARRLGRAMIFLLVIAVLFLFRPLVGALQGILGVDVSGFSGRYSSGTGRIYETIVWIRNHPFSPIGFTETDRLIYGDSGYVDYFLRGNLPSLIGVYIALVAMVTRFLGRSRLAIHLCAAIMAFDLGFSALPLWRLQLVLVPILLGLSATIPAEPDPGPIPSPPRKAMVT